MGTTATADQWDSLGFCAIDRRDRERALGRFLGLPNSDRLIPAAVSGERGCDPDDGWGTRERAKVHAVSQVVVDRQQQVESFTSGGEPVCDASRLAQDDSSVVDACFFVRRVASQLAGQENEVHTLRGIGIEDARQLPRGAATLNRPSPKNSAVKNSSVNHAELDALSHFVTRPRAGGSAHERHPQV